MVLSCTRGLPIDANLNGYADCPDGHRHWGGLGIAGPATAHRTTDAGPYWAASDAAVYWESAAGTGLTQQLACYVGRDTLGRLAFYDSEINGINGGTTGRLPLAGVAFGALVLAPTPRLRPTRRPCCSWPSPWQPCYRWISPRPRPRW